MSKYLRKFETTVAYDAAESTLVKPNVSYIVATNGVYFNPVPPPFFAKLTLNNDEVVELEGSGELTDTIMNPYKSTLVSAEIGTLCTSISNNVFRNCISLINIEIPNSVTIIGNSAFYGCTNLISVSISSGITSINEGTFSGCNKLTNITIPDSVTSIGVGAFNGCSSLTTITIPSGVTIISYSAFQGCRGLTSVTIPSGVTSIGDYAFSYCSGLTNITIGNSVTSIGNSAFYQCSGLTSVTSLATTAPTIQSSTFQNVKTGGTLTVPNGSTGYDVWMGTGDYYLGNYNWTKVEQ